MAALHGLCRVARKVDALKALKSETAPVLPAPPHTMVDRADNCRVERDLAAYYLSRRPLVRSRQVALDRALPMYRSC